MLSALLVQLCELYNMCLERRVAHYKQGKHNDQQGELNPAAHRHLSRKQKGSQNRLQAKERLRRRYQRIRGKRRTSLAQSHLSKSILDAAWRELLLQITYKAEEAGKWAVAVAPGGTSQICSGCGTKVPKKLGHRRHDCQN